MTRTEIVRSFAFIGISETSPCLMKDYGKRQPRLAYKEERIQAIALPLEPRTLRLPSSNLSCSGRASSKFHVSPMSYEQMRQRSLPAAEARRLIGSLTGSRLSLNVEWCIGRM